MDDASGLPVLDLPPGFRFHPTDEEIVSCYLKEKVLSNSFRARAIGEVDLNKCEPWDLPSKANMGENEWYFFCQRDRKYPTGMRTNRATEAGYWKATGKDKEIYKRKGCLIGMKKTLVFYKGRAPKGEKTNWVMHEYRLEGKFTYCSLSKSAKDEWVVCRVFHKSKGLQKSPSSSLLRMGSFGEELLDCSTLPPLLDPTFHDETREDPEFKGAAISEPRGVLDAYKSPYFSNSQENLTDYKFNFLPSHPQINHQSNSINMPQNAILNPQTSSNNPLLPITSANLRYLHPYMNENAVLCSSNSSLPSAEAATMRAMAITNEASSSNIKCKMEQFSNQSMVSQDTGLTNDVTTEISSQHSKEMFSNTSFVDLDYLLNY